MTDPLHASLLRRSTLPGLASVVVPHFLSALVAAASSEASESRPLQGSSLRCEPS